jgi:hypothetical protein
MEVPSQISLVDCQSGQTVTGQVAGLDREMAKDMSPGWNNSNWWTTCTGLISEIDEQPDSHWDWVALVSRAQNKPMRRSVCVFAADGSIQGAMLYRVGVQSVLEPGEKAVLIDRLASAPGNRAELVGTPRFRGIGDGLLRYALAESWSYGLKGRVNLFPVAHLEFYTNRRFVRTDVMDKDGIDYLHEIPAADAAAMLRDHGVL